MTRKVIAKSILNWWGGKGTSAARIKSILPRHRKYVEVFGGGGHVLFQKDESREEVYNDLHEGLVNFWRVMQDEDKVKVLKKKLELTPISRLEFYHCRDTWAKEKCEIEKARKFFIVVNQSFSVNLTTWRVGKGREGVSLVASRLYELINKGFAYIPNRIKRVKIENLDYRDILEKYDGEDVLFYLDPPYVGESRTIQKGYDYEMTDVTLHVELVDLLLKLKGKAVLSGYEHPVYDRLVEHGWGKVLLGEYAKTSAYVRDGGKLNKGREVLWFNYDLLSEEHVFDIFPAYENIEEIRTKFEQGLLDKILECSDFEQQFVEDLIEYMRGYNYLFENVKRQRGEYVKELALLKDIFIESTKEGLQKEVYKELGFEFEDFKES